MGLLGLPGQRDPGLRIGLGTDLTYARLCPLHPGPDRQQGDLNAPGPGLPSAGAGLGARPRRTFSVARPVPDGTLVLTARWRKYQSGSYVALARSQI
jgi:hypothetical protein